MTRIFLFLLIFTAVMSPFAARADSGDALPIELRFGANIIGSEHGEASFWRLDGSVGVDYEVVPGWYSIYADVHMGNAAFNFDGEMAPGLGVDGSFMAPFSLSLEMGNRLTILHRSRISVDLYVSLETTVMRDRFQANDVEITTDQGTFNVTPYAEEHTTTEFSWNRISAGTTFYLNLNPMMPKLSLGFERVSLTVDELLDDNSRGALMKLSEEYPHIEKSYENAHYSVVIMPGMDFGVSDSIMITTEAMFLPMATDWVFGGSVGMKYGF